MSTDEVKIDIAPEIESYDKKDELMTSPPQEQVTDTTIASENSSSDEKLENETSPPQDLPVRDTTAVSKEGSSNEIVENETLVLQENDDDTRFNEDRKKLYQAILWKARNPWGMKTVGISENEDYPIGVFLSVLKAVLRG
ncbi:uncharacterized protein LOC116139967 isoform X2 [Pistacia vera]|uniref:uncharacterized protein LOC116139967 isoform X2 n=1 Tax=Pistacia vera TaxID=55513 RepID=UPI00126361A9|nr:uncharacterized protein LOC116139967 isoform X2 [Pistacia vera]